MKKRIGLILVLGATFTLFNISNVKAIVSEHINNSVIHTMSYDDRVEVPEDYQWTFAISNIKKDTVETCTNCNWYLEMKDKGSIGATRNDIARVNTTDGTYNYSHYEITKNNMWKGKVFPSEYFPNSDRITYLVNRHNGTDASIDYCRDNTAEVYVYYPYVGIYEGKKVGLKITLIDYKAFSKIRMGWDTGIEDNGTNVVPIISFFRSRPKIEMYGVNSAQFKYEFIDDSCYQSSGKTNYSHCIMDNIKGYGTLTDIDGGQAITLNTQKNSGITEINSCSTSRLNGISKYTGYTDDRSGVTGAYIYKYSPDVCYDYRSYGTDGTRCYNDSSCNSSTKSKWYKNARYGSNIGKCVSGKVTSNPYSGANEATNVAYGYSYLIPNYLPYEATSMSGFSGSNPYYSKLKEGLVLADNVNDTRVGYNLYLSKSGLTYKYREKLNTVSSPQIAAKVEKYSWIQIMFKGSFSLTYYFSDPEAYNKEQSTCNGKTGGCDRTDIDRTYIINGYTAESDRNKVDGGGGGTYEFTQDSLLFLKPDVVYRTIDTTPNPDGTELNYFLDKKGNIRNVGSNWCSNSTCSGKTSANTKIQQYIKNRRNSSYTGGATWTYTLDANKIKAIRQCSTGDLNCVKDNL